MKTPGEWAFSYADGEDGERLTATLPAEAAVMPSEALLAALRGGKRLYNVRLDERPEKARR